MKLSPPSDRSSSLRGGALLAVLALLAACDADPAPREAAAPAAAPGGAAPQEAYAPPATAAGDASGDTLDLTRIGYDRGSEDAPVVVIEFSDFGCPYCSVFALQTYPELHREFVETGKVKWKYVPFVMGMFPNGAEAARASECAAEQGKFWAMHDLLFQRQREWKGNRSPEALFGGYAQQLQLDAARFASCYREDRGAARTRANNALAERLGMRATPSFIVDGRLVEGALPAEQFRQILQQAVGTAE